MTHIYERLFLRCPYVLAREYLCEALEKAAFALQNGVLVQYERGRDPLHFHEPWNVYWLAHGGGARPDFCGELAVRADATHRGAVLELRGDYAPPPFIPDTRTPDVLTGSKHACGTARTLLERIASLMEDRYLTEGS